MRQPISDKAIVISRLDYGEKDRILTLLCEETGKVRALAKSVRSAKSKLAGGIELFSQTEIGLVSGKSGLYTLTSARLIEHYDRLAEKFDRVMLAYDAQKLLDRTVEDEHGQEFYPVLTSALKALNNESISKDLTQLWFYLQILSLSGHAPNLSTDTDKTRLSENEKYNFDHDNQCFFQSVNGIFSSDHIKLMRTLISQKRFINVIAKDETVKQSLRLVSALVADNLSR